MQSHSYRDFYLNRIEEGDLVILDNGAWEGELVKTSDLIKLGQALGPAEIALPDVMLDGKTTVKIAEKAADNMRHKLTENTVFMGIPQGKTFAEWKSCLHQLINIPGVTTIGLARNIDDNRDKFRHGSIVYSGRDLCLEYMEREGIADIFDVHLLGWGNRALEHLADIAEHWPWVRGVDTTQPVKLGLSRIKLSVENGLGERARTKRTEDFFIFPQPTSQQDECIVHNIKVYQQWCQC